MAQRKCGKKTYRAFSLCDGDCYWRYPNTVNPFSKACTNGGKPKDIDQYGNLCLALTKFCDTVEDCDNGSDELNCGLGSSIDIYFTLIITFAIFTMIFLAYNILLLFGDKRDTMKEGEKLPLSKFLVKVDVKQLHDQKYALSMFETWQFDRILFNKDSNFLKQLSFWWYHQGQTNFIL